MADEVEKEGIVPAGAFDFLPHGDAFGMGANDVDRASAGTWSPLELNVAATITQRFLNISYASRWTLIRKRSQSVREEHSLRARSRASSASRAVTVKGMRSAFLRSMKTRQRGWMTSRGFFMAAKIGGLARESESRIRRPRGNAKALECAREGPWGAYAPSLDPAHGRGAGD